MTPEELSREAKQKLGIVCSRMLWDQPFWATALLRLKKLEITPELTAQLEQQGMPSTMCTDGKSIEYNPAFVMSLNSAELEFVLAHEVMHCIHEHQIRRQGRNPLLWNIAADFSINGILVDCHVGTAPSGVCLNSNFKSLNAEEIYNKLLKNAKKMAYSNAKAAGGLIMDSPSSSSHDEQRAVWKEIVADAAARAKAIGKLPSELEKLISDWIEPKAPWQDKIAWWFQERIKGAFTWTKRNRRVPDVYLPARDDEIKGRLVLAFDTSGSMWYTKDIFRRVLGAIDELLSSFKCEADLIDIDAAVSNHVHIDCGERLEKYSPKGGGGTSFIPAFKWTEENLSEMPDGLIYFTDLDGTFPKHAPQYPVLWVTWNKKHCEPPFGDLLEIEEN